MSLKEGRHRRSSSVARIVSSVILIVAGLFSVGFSATAYADDEKSETECTWEWNRSIPQEHVEYMYKLYHEGTAATPDQWWNWSPNNSQGPQDYEPAFPTDPRGTWQGPHENGGPRQGTYGTFQTGSPGNSNWFHREQGTEGTEAYWEITEWLTFMLGDPWLLVDERTVQDEPIVQGPVRSADEPDRGDYPDVAWVKDDSTRLCDTNATPVQGEVTFTEGSVECVEGEVVYTNPSYTVAGSEHVVYDTPRGENVAEFGQTVTVNATGVDDAELYELTGDTEWSHTFGSQPEAPTDCGDVPPPSTPELTVTSHNSGSCSVQVPTVQVEISDDGSLGVQLKGSEAVDWQLREVTAGSHALSLDAVARGDSVIYRVVYSPLDDSSELINSGWVTFVVPSVCGSGDTPPPSGGVVENPTFGTGAGMPSGVIGSERGLSALWVLAGMMGGLLLIAAGGGSLATMRRRDVRG